MFPLSFAVIQDQHRFLRCGFCLIGTKRCICALALCLIFVCRCCTEIKNWHVLYSSFSENIFRKADFSIPLRCMFMNTIVSRFAFSVSRIGNLNNW